VVECLSFHANYKCRHSGACCRTSWNLPFTPEERGRVERLRLVSRPFDGRLTPDGVSFAARRDDGACVFLEDTSLCAIHRAAGPDALPETCRMFPRIVRHDAIGTRLSLSHYCPTAAAMLFEDVGPAAIVEAPAALTHVGPFDGLDAREAWPPLLRDGVLMDVESYRLWETRGVALLTPERTTAEALNALETVTTAVAAWQPGSGPLRDAVDSAFAAAPHAGDSRTAPACDRAVGRWLAARLFGNWIAYQGRGLATIVAYLRACLDIFTIEHARDGNALEALRRSDYLIVHEADAQELARRLER
jgi:Fe-S-cluster containining protein